MLNIVKPSVKLIKWFDWDQVTKQLEGIIRLCYKSEDQISEGSDHRLIQRIIDRGHGAMLEHFSFTVVFTVDRGVSHELVRHRMASFAQESTRYCNYSHGKFDNKVTFVDISGGIALNVKMSKMSVEQIKAILEEWYDAAEDCERHYMRMVELGAPAEIARSVLMNSTKTEIAMTANVREWLHVLDLRSGVFAHPQMREVIYPLVEGLANEVPIFFGGINQYWREHINDEQIDNSGGSTGSRQDNSDELAEGTDTVYESIPDVGPQREGQ